MTMLLALAVALLAGLMMSRLTKLWNLPAVTAYLVAGVLIGPYVLGRLGVPGLGFVSAADVGKYGIISDVALGFIALAMGNEFRIADIKKLGKQAVVVAVFQALTATVLVDAALIGLHFLMPEALPLSVAVTLGAVAAATAPAATLMIVKQYKSHGPVTRMLLPVVALDDVVGLILFAVSFGIARALEHGTVDMFSVIVDPLLEVVASLALGALLGAIFAFTERFFHSRSKRLSISVCYVFLAVAMSQLSFRLGPVTLGFSSLLVCMALGTVFCNLCEWSSELMDRLDRWTGPIMVLFFVLSGAGMELNVFRSWQVVLAGVIFILVRSAGKILGANFSSRMMKCEPTVRKYLGFTLLPQAGVALGMSMTAMSLGAPGLIIRNISLFAVLIYELVGPLLTKIALDKAGEITDKPVPPRKQAMLNRKGVRADNTAAPGDEHVWASGEVPASADGGDKATK
ncbi:MAG: cation:proton antiporter [Clostridia bacterium]|nr:cation:proton antiporter [Clostridia bacterium]